MNIIELTILRDSIYIFSELMNLTRVHYQCLSWKDTDDEFCSLITYQF